MDKVDLKSVGLFSVLLFAISAYMMAPAAGQTVSHGATASDPLDQDSRLNRQVTVTETGISLKTLLHQLSVRDLTLTALRSCEEQKLQIRVRQRPLRALMSSISELLGGTWQPNPDKTGYRFSQTDATVLRRSRWWALFLGEREQVLAELRAEMLQAMRAPQKPIHYSVGGNEASAEQKAHFQGIDSAFHGLFAQLPTAVQEQLAQQIIVDGFYSNANMLGGDTSSVDGSFIVSFADLPPSAQDAVMHAVTITNAPAESHGNVPTVAYLRLRNSDFHLNAEMLDATGQTVGMAGADAGRSDRMYALLLNQDPLARVVQRLGRHASPTGRALADYQNSTVWKNDPSPGFQRDFNPPPHRSEVLSWLASQGHFEFVADYYSLPCSLWSEEDQQQPLPQLLKEELDFRAAEQDMSWKKRTDKILLFRDNRWYRDDNLEAPNDLLSGWIAQQAEIDQAKPTQPKGAPLPIAYVKRVLDLRADVVSKLTPWQIANGFKYAVAVATQKGTEAKQHQPDAPSTATNSSKRQLPFGDLADLIMEDRNLLGFYSGLADDQRLALLGGELDYSTLSAPDQEAVRYLEPLVSVALRRSGLLQTNQPVQIGLTPTRGEGHSYFANEPMILHNKTGVPGVKLTITSPLLSSDQSAGGH